MKGTAVLISNWFSGLDPIGKVFVIFLGIWLFVRITAAVYDRWVARKTDV
jgi:hypothetical protein